MAVLKLSYLHATSQSFALCRVMQISRNKALYEFNDSATRSSIFNAVLARLNNSVSIERENLTFPTAKRLYKSVN